MSTLWRPSSRAVPLDVLVRRRGLAERRVRRRRQAVALHEVLGEFLRTLQPRGGPPRPEDPQSHLLERIDDAVGERRFRPDNRKRDAFFPFRDGLDVVADAGAIAVIQPGGSLRDEEVIAAADERAIAMVFTGYRHFRH